MSHANVVMTKRQNETRCEADEMRWDELSINYNNNKDKENNTTVNSHIIAERQCPPDTAALQEELAASFRTNSGDSVVLSATDTSVNPVNPLGRSERRMDLWPVCRIF
ncbi:GH17743 [Drosophila grimshawi]|uniref:GH17743 n=1 Tax=Drosophila grimshawi TaxID=7222 RepID=B4JXN0_DROGR|nr:GH17743 [Drosophila grimshawi]